MKKRTSTARGLAIGLTVAARLSAAPEPAAPPSQATAPPTTKAAAAPVPDRPPAELEGLNPAPGGLTAAEVSRRVLAVAPSVKEKRAELAAANEKINQTTIQFFPRLTLLASYTRLSPVNVGFGSGALVGALNPGLLSTGPCAPGAPTTCVVDSKGIPAQAAAFSLKFPVDNYSVGARVSIPLSDYIFRLSDAAASSSASKESARYALLGEKAKMDADARTLYFNWLRARAQAAIAEKAVEQTRARLSDAQAAFSVGTISKADLLRIEALVANTELVASRSESLVAFTNGQLGIAMVDLHPNYTVGEGVPLPGAIPRPDAPMEHLIQKAIHRRYEVRALDEAVRALSHGASAQRGGALPRVEAFGDATYANPNARYFPPAQEWHLTWSLGVQASWTVNDTFGSTAAARELDANAKSMEAKRTALRAGIAQEVLGAYLDAERARAAFDKQQTALAAAQEAYRVTTDLFRAGRATGTDLIESEMGLLDAKLGDVNARIDLTIASIALKHAVGDDTAPAADASAD